MLGDFSLLQEVVSCPHCAESATKDTQHYGGRYRMEYIQCAHCGYAELDGESIGK